MLTGAPRGTKDILPQTVGYWQYLESSIRKLCQCYGYLEIRTPIFEHTELFLRGIGDTTDIVQKEMYTFKDRGDRSLTLRPENTAAVVRSYIENKLYVDSELTKLFYIGPMFRYDRPQAGRYRQFHQFGVEAIGGKGPDVDAEIIALAVDFFHSIGLKDLKVLINSVGCPNCRPIYKDKLKEFLKDNLPNLCADCQGRFEKNPLRILDCKNHDCQQIVKNVPLLKDSLCDECSEHFDGLKSLLTSINIDYQIDDKLVRGLDYYTKTAFEIQYSPLGAQSAVCGGGRYDGLIQECGGNPTPGIGFAVGLERVLLALEKQGLLAKPNMQIDAYVIYSGQEAKQQAFVITTMLRRAGLSSYMDFSLRTIKAQMKSASRMNSRFALIIGEDELKYSFITIKDMDKQEQTKVSLCDTKTIISKIEVSKKC